MRTKFEQNKVYNFYLLAFSTQERPFLDFSLLLTIKLAV